MLGRVDADLVLDDAVARFDSKRLAVVAMRRPGALLIVGRLGYLKKGTT